MAVNMDTKKNKRYVIYTRCSTDDQGEGDFTTLDVQAHHCKNMLDAFGYELADIGNKGIVNDDGYSGKDLHRPGIQSILNDVQTKKSFDGIIFLKLDRLTRNPRDLYALIDLFKEKNFDFISVRENLDSSTAIGRVVIGILGLLSAFERELTGERVKASAIARVRQGLRIGGRTPIGYILVPDGPRLANDHQPMKAVINEDMAPHIRVIFEMAANNRSLTEIGQELLKRGINTKYGNIWRRQGLSIIVKNPFYKGYIKYNGEIYKAKHDPIISEALWEKANRILVARLPGHSLVKGITGYAFLLSSLIKCGSCDSHMVNSHSAGRSKNKFFYYECARARQALGCSCNRISAPGFDKAIIRYFKQATENQDVITKAIGNAELEAKLKLEKIEARLTEKEAGVSTLRHNADKLIELAINNTITQGSTYKTKLAGIESEIEKLSEEIDKLQAQKQVAQIDASSGEFLHSNIKLAMQYLELVSPEVQKSLLQALIKDIIVYDDKITLNMYIEQGLADILPKIVEKLPKNGKSPIPTIGEDKALALTPCGSQGRPVWGG